ncbi:Heat shock factor protein [Actinidia chinensis var. chinensis]|uniref:Heat shock factor protein n=1 Tax=Actinidia chinensis var. chinensis TaxID=1590841 RepID=A0A2R6RL50_ACTCC|nr:Heat shock factor protein [Actinidia chinensis var. chinensis]
MGQRSVPAPFLMKTYKLVDDQSTDEVIGWNEGGTTFVVWKTDNFSKDLLPKYFKHNNFSSFVRQLNTYGFRKIVPDKWEFANENFKRGQKELLVQICRRKTATSTPAAAKSAPGPSSPLNSGDDLGSTSTSTSDSKNARSVDAPTERIQFADLSDENKKLKRDNEMLTSELARAKKHCGELIAFLTEYIKVAPDQMDHIMRQGSSGLTLGGLDGEIGSTGHNNCNDDDPNNQEIMKEENDEGLKLFGVWVKGDGKKRGREDNLGFGGAHRKEMKRVEFTAPWMTGKVCN